MKLKAFLNSEATTKYIRIFNNLFDIMNSKINHTNAAFKRPISESSLQEFQEFFKEAKTYIKSLKLIEGGKMKPILKTRTFTAFFGFYHNICSIIGVYNDFIKYNGYNEFYAYNVSQDHLETFFGAIRSMGGEFI